MKTENDEKANLKAIAKPGKEMKQSKYFVAYMDILGYKDFFKSHPDDTETFLETIRRAFEEAIEQIESYDQKIELSSSFLSELQIKIFSDNVLICTKCKQKDEDNILPYLRLVKLMANLQMMFINKYNLFIRGSIVRGQFYINEQFVFGDALIKACEMESKVALFPRIVLEKDEIQKLLKYVNGRDNKQSGNSTIDTVIRAACTSSIGKEKDGTFFINYLSASRAKNMFMNVLEITDFFSDDQSDDQGKENKKKLLSVLPIEERLMSHKRSLVMKMNHDCNFNSVSGLHDQQEIESRKSIISKYVWVLDYHNQACEIARLKKHKIATRIRVDSKLHQIFIEAIEE